MEASSVTISMSNGNNTQVTIDDWMTTISATTENGSNTVHAGDLITIAIAAAPPLLVTGQPALQLSNNETATYVSGAGTNTLTFDYMVKSGDDTADLQITGINLPDGASVVYAAGDYPFGTAGGIPGFLHMPNARPMTDITHDLGIHIDTTTTDPTSVQQEVMGLYAALYGRAGELSGFSYWVGLVSQQSDAAGLTAANAGVTPIMLSEAVMLGQNFVNSQNTFFNATYGGLTDSQFIRAMYQNIGGSAGDSDGISYWASLLADAEAHGQSAQAARAGIAGQFVDALIGFDATTRPLGLTDQQWTDAQTRTQTINNKIAVSTAYANACTQNGGDILIPHAVNDAAYQAAAAVLQSVTADPNSVAVALAGINNAVAHHDLGLI